MDKSRIKRRIIDNKIVRVLSYPYINYKHIKDKQNYIRTGYGKTISKFKNMYVGERCIIVANGPSLRYEDLEKIKSSNIKSFGMNHIYDLFNVVDWRPDFYICFDREFIADKYSEICNLPIDNIFIEYSKIPKSKDIIKQNVYYFFSDYVFAIKRGTAITNHVCTELEKETSFVTNVTHLCIEFAIYMGFKEIYLIGVDHDYSFGYGKNHVKGISEGKHNDENHYVNSDMNVSQIKFRQYEEYAKKNNIKIFNATRGGKLEVFERINIDNLL